MKSCAGNFCKKASREFKLQEISDISAPPSENFTCCESKHIAAYLDGEINFVECARFEDHIKECAACAVMLREHKELLRLLETARADESFTLPLPKNFAQLLRARAQSDMSGVRAGGERKLALWLCAPLVLLCIALLGNTGCTATLAFALMIVRHAASVFVLILRALYDVGAGLNVILRAVGRNLAGVPRPVNLLALLILAVALGSLPRLISNCRRRAQEIAE